MINIARQAATITLAVTLLVPVAGAETPEIRIFGSANEIIAEYKSANFWGKIEKGTENEWLAGLAANYGLLKEDEVLPEGDALPALVAELMMRVDAVPSSFGSAE